jgi:hypothetical protein
VGLGRKRWRLRLRKIKGMDVPEWWLKGFGDGTAERVTAGMA